jgi:hypothetical protein
MSTVNVNRVIDASGGVLAPISSVMRNRIINGACVIDQRNAGASVTPTTLNNVYPVDRFVTYASQSTKYTAQQNAGSVTPPVGFSNYLGFTSSSAYSVTSSDFFLFGQRIEGFNTYDLNWGTANAKTVTISFWVRSSLTGTFGGALRNSANNRFYPFSYTISSANTWEYKTITVAGDTTGTWVGATNGTGLEVLWSLGSGSTFSGAAGVWGSSPVFSATGATSVVGTNGATFYITGVQLEVGTQATSFEYRQYQQEFALCQRYYYRLTPNAIGEDYASGWCNSTTTALINLSLPVSMRASPSALEQSGTAANYTIRNSAGVTTCSAVPTFYSTSVNSALVQLTVASGLTAGQGVNLRPAATGAFLAWSAEL